MGEFQRAYDSVDEMMKSMPCELEWEAIHDFTVFRSKNNDELSRRRPDLCMTNSYRGIGPLSLIKSCLKHWLKFVRMENYLIQIWAPVTVGDKRYLTTADQPFVMGELVKGLCSYRKQCLDYLIPIDDMSTEEGHVGPPGRVFLNGEPEVCLDVRHYTTKEYPQRDSAPNYGIRSYLALPVYNYISHAYDRVVELVANGFQPPMYNFANRIYPMHGGEVVHFVSATSHAENVNNAEQNIDNIGEIVQLDDATNNTENTNTNVAEQNDSMEQRDTNSNISENRRAIKRIEREYEITLADLLQHSGKKQEEAANHFGVSRSTFKRICRTHGICRWPPSKAKKLRCTPQESVPAAERNVEDQRTVYQSVFNLPHLKQYPSCEARALQGGRSVHDRSSMMVKVKETEFVSWKF